MRKIIITATLLLVMTITMHPLVSALPTVGTNVNVTDNSFNQNEPMVAINPLDHNKLVVGFNDERTGTWKAAWSWSDDGGTTWTFGGSFSLPGYTRSADPVVAFDNTGTAYFAGLCWNYPGYPADGSIFLAKSNDGGHTFTVFQKIVAAGSGTSNYLDKPWLFVNPANNNIYLAWTKRVNAFSGPPTETSTIWFTRSTNGGMTFSTPVQVSQLNPTTYPMSHGAQIAAGPGSSVYVSWHTVELGTLDADQDGVVDPGWQPPEIWISESIDEGATFGTNHLVATKQYSYPNRFISMGADPSIPRIYVTYADRPSYPGDYDAYVATSASSAGPWAITRVNDDPVGNDRWQFWPSLGVAPNGRVDVIWYDGRDDPAKYGVYYTSSFDEGATWETNTKVTDIASGFTWPDPPYFGGDYITVASVNEKAEAVWMDYRLGGGNLEIYTATLIIPIGVPYHAQIKWYYCGPACLEMVFDFYGPDVSQNEIADAARTDIAYAGTFTDDMRRAAHFSDLSTSVGNEMPGSVTGYTGRSLGYAAFEHYFSGISGLKPLIDAGYPIVVLTAGDADKEWGHFRVVVGYDDVATEITMQDPLFGANYKLSYTTFDDWWQYWSGRWGLFTHPWEVSVTTPPGISQGDTFTVSSTVSYPCPPPFSPGYSASSAQATIQLPAGLSLATGETATKTLDTGTIGAGGSASVQWGVNADSAGALTISVEAEGQVSGSVATHAPNPGYSYTDRIGGTSSASVAVTPQLTLEDVRTWHWVDDTSISPVACGDVDGDPAVEIVTGGRYNDGTRDNSQLTVWDGGTLQGVRTWHWVDDTEIWSVAVGDVDGDGSVEIVTGGRYHDGFRTWAQLCVWDGSTLALEGVTTWYWTSSTNIWSVVVGDVDGDGQTEIVTGGRYYDGTRFRAQLCVWDGSTLSLEGVRTWYWASDTTIFSVACADVDGDGLNEIVTGGDYYDGSRYWAQLCVWDGSTLSLEGVETWYWTGSTHMYSVAVADVDGDGSVEIVTGGRYLEPGVRWWAQLAVWDGATLSLEGVKTWYLTSDTYIWSVAVGDVDADGSVEIITGGYHYDGSRYVAQLCVWDGSTLALEDATTWYWTHHTKIESVAIADVDGDGDMEIVTGGRYNDGTRDNAQLCVWGYT